MATTESTPQDTLSLHCPCLPLHLAGMTLYGSPKLTVGEIAPILPWARNFPEAGTPPSRLLKLS